MAVSPLYFAFTVDLDPDNFDTSIFGSVRTLTWQGIDRGLPLLLEAVRPAHLKDGSGQPPRFTWFVRADQELQDTYRSYTYLFDLYNEFIQARRNDGDEVGWHPHVTELPELHDSYQALQKRGLGFSSVRIGNSFHSNSFMAALAQWGFTVDSTALPDRIRSDRERMLNWVGTPRKPYFPAVHDYRSAGSPAHPILEVPISMIETQASYDRGVVPRYLNLSYQHAIIKDSIASLVEQEDLLVAIVHPSELLKREDKHPLIAFDIDEVLSNLIFILEKARALGRDLQYITISEVARLITEKKISYAP